MGKFIDMTGWVMAEHGVSDSRWTVLGPDLEWNNTHTGTKKWICQCNCDKHSIRSVYGNYLRQGQSKSCGCLAGQLAKERQTIDMTGWNMWEHGVENSRLTILGPDPNWKRRGSGWICQCNCQAKTIFSANGVDIRDGNTTSCGCKRTERLQSLTIDLTGMHLANYGVLGSKVTVIALDHSDYGQLYWRCKCDCGKEFIARGSHLKTGAIRSCGCLGASFGEQFIEEWLKSKHILYQREVTFDDCRSLEHNGLFRYDFGIYNTANKLLGLIEYNGIQHYEEHHFSDLAIRQAYDQQKINYCKSHLIPLYIIKYNENIEIRLTEIMEALCVELQSMIKEK